VFPLGGSRDQKSRSPQEKAPSRSSKVQCGEKKGCRYRRSVADHSIVRVARLPPVFSDLRFMRLFIFGRCMGERRANMDFSPREPDSWDVPPGEPAAGKASAFLRLEAISKTYSARDGKPVRALDEISCEIRLGEIHLDPWTIALPAIADGTGQPRPRAPDRPTHAMPTGITGDHARWTAATMRTGPRPTTTQPARPRRRACDRGVRPRRPRRKARSGCRNDRRPVGPMVRVGESGVFQYQF
jgi:hypothetical protein